MKNPEIDKIVEWLGPGGAAAGLDKSPLTVSDLYKLGVERGALVEKRMRRVELINELVNQNTVRIEKLPEELMSMKYQELKLYFESRRVSKTELLKLLSEFDIRPGKESADKLTHFAAREISDFGMYKRVSEGTRRG